MAIDSPINTPVLKKRYTSILTLAFTALVTFDLFSVSAWIVYHQWISPLINMRFGSTKSEKDRLSEWTEIHPYGKPSQNDSSSDVSDTSTLTDVIPVFTRAQAMLGSGIRSGIRTLTTTLDSVMHDIEHAMPVPIQRTAHHNVVSPARTSHNSTLRTSRMATTPSSLVFPTEPQRTFKLEHHVGEVCDLEYSHHGLVLAVAR
jgi:hypothetical protein